MTHLVIVAGGLASRLAPLTNYMPKFFVNIGKETGYVEMLRYWTSQIDFHWPDSTDLTEDEIAEFRANTPTLTVIVHSKYVSMVAEYHKIYFPKLPLLIKTVDEANGSAHAILSTCSHLDGKPVLFTWCDVIPVDPLPVFDLGEMYHGSNVVFTNYNASNRYELVRTGKGWADVKPALSPIERGGIFGLYYVDKFRTNADFKPGQDFVEVIEQYGPIREHRLDRIVDFGDLPKLERVRDTADAGRSFNSIEFVGDYVKKTALNEQGMKVIGGELLWYRKHAEMVPNPDNRLPVPKVWISPDEDSLFMTRAKGTPIWQAWPKLSPVDRLHVLTQLVGASERTFEATEFDVRLDRALTDVRIETLTKLQNRYNEIRGIIDAFGPVSMVNGVRLTHSPEQMFTLLHAALESFYTRTPASYGLIHGDLQLSNSLVDLETMKVSIIDPRGYFGETKVVGLQDYDRAKLFYSLSGYDTFNYDRKFCINKVLDEIEFDIRPLDFEGIEDFVQANFGLEHELWLAVIWIALGQYIKNDPIKAIAAHYHGMTLGEKVLASL
jgi:hypothetical protein